MRNKTNYMTPRQELEADALALERMISLLTRLYNKEANCDYTSQDTLQYLKARLNSLVYKWAVLDSKLKTLPPIIDVRILNTQKSKDI